MAFINVRFRYHTITIIILLLLVFLYINLFRDGDVLPYQEHLQQVWKQDLEQDTRSSSPPLVLPPVPVEGIELLSNAAQQSLHNCVPLALSKSATDKNVNISPCQAVLRFRNSSGPVVALVSYPGSGNTWLRYLLEQVTGILTGSAYCDNELKSFFFGEHVVSGNVLLVKTHTGRFGLEDPVQALGSGSKVEKAIILVRNPFNAIVSEAHRRYGKSSNQLNHHLHTAGIKFFTGRATR